MTGERAPSRHVDLGGAVNVRDIGDRSVHGPKHSQAFRGGALSQLTSATSTGSTGSGCAPS